MPIDNEEYLHELFSGASRAKLLTWQIMDIKDSDPQRNKAMVKQLEKAIENGMEPLIR